MSFKSRKGNLAKGLQDFSFFGTLMCRNHLVELEIWIQLVWLELLFLISNNIPQDADAAGLRAMR